MGTSANYPGSTNWGPVKSETTRVGGEGHVTSEKAASIISAVVEQMRHAPQLGFGPSSERGARSRGYGLGGGGGSGGGGRGGRASSSARSVASGLGGFLADVKGKGFREALAERGLTDLNGKSPDEIALALADLLGGSGSLIEETALRDALIAVVLEWSENADGLDDLEGAVANAAENIEAALHSFFAHYIFEVFETIGSKGVIENHGWEKANNMAEQIRDFIDAKLAMQSFSRPLSSIDWRGSEGAAVVDGIVNNTIEIFGDQQP